MIQEILNLDRQWPKSVNQFLREGSNSLEAYYPELGRTLGEELLEPHRCYYVTLKPVIDWRYGSEGQARKEQRVKGMAHITGGGLFDNVARILPQGLTAVFNSDSWTTPPIFDLIQERGNVEKKEMYRVFNMGIGMALFCSPGDVDRLMKDLPESKIVGEVLKQYGEARVVIK